MGSVRVLRLRLRNFLREFLEKGFWFHRFQSAIKVVHESTSIGFKFKRWVAAGDVHTPPGAPELYQIILLFIAIAWVAAIRTPANSLFASIGARIFGIIIAGYFIFELLLFLLDWVFVEGIPIEDYRRSLATLIVASVEVAFLFSVLFALTGCQDFSRAPIVKAYHNWQSLVKLDAVDVTGSLGCAILAQTQWMLGALLVGVIIASLLGPIVRPERKTDRSGRSARSR